MKGVKRTEKRLCIDLTMADGQEISIWHWSGSNDRELERATKWADKIAALSIDKIKRERRNE